MRKILIKNANIVLVDKVLENSNCLIEEGRIAYVGKEKVDSHKIVDGKGCYLLPGFIDIHCHGGNGYDFMDATKEEMLEIAKFHLSHGTTSLYATTMTDTWENIESSLTTYSELFKENNLLTLKGVHLEGPWFSPAQCGAQDTSNMENPNKERVDYLVGKYPFVKRISMAPEIPNAMEVGEYAYKKGLVVSAGHTDADFETIEQANKKGYSLLTHFYSGMAGVVRKNAYRVAGAVEAGYYLDDLDVEIIADGKHLPESLLKLIYKIKGAERISLITDGTRGSGLKDGEEFKLGRLDTGVDSIIEDGVAKLPCRTCFAGSVATCDRLFRTMINIGVNIVEVSKMASITPARVMGLNERGSIEVGKIGDLVLMDEDLNIKKVFLKGEEQNEISSM